MSAAPFFAPFAVEARKLNRSLAALLAIAVPALIAVFGLGDLIAKGTSLLFMIPTAVTGSVNNMRNGLVDVRAGLIVGVAATVASFGGAALAFVMSPAVSSYLFAALLLVSAVQLTVRAIRMRRA